MLPSVSSALVQLPQLVKSATLLNHIKRLLLTYVNPAPKANLVLDRLVLTAIPAA